MVPLPSYYFEVIVVNGVVGLVIVMMNGWGVLQVLFVELRLLRDWKRLQFRQCNYKNHRIFTLRCLHNDLVPVSIKLKSTLKSERAKKILRTAEQQLLQTRLKSINSLLDNNAKQLELTRSKIASILTAPKLPTMPGIYREDRGEKIQQG